MNENRLNVVRALVELSCSLDVLEARLQNFDWDYEGCQIELNRMHIINLLERYLSQELLASDVERWANLLEGREDICFESDIEEQLDKVLYQLANPILTCQLNEFNATQLIKMLSR